MPLHDELVRAIPNRLLLAGLVLLLGVVLGWIAGRVNERLLRRAGVPQVVEGTAFERTMHSFGTSTVSVIGSLSMWFVIGVAVLAALSVAQVSYMQLFLGQVTALLPQLFLATIVLIIGMVVGDKLELVIGERLRGIKLPEIALMPKLAKYSVVYIAVLVALGQIGVATTALVVLLGVYAFAIVVFGAVAFRDLLRSGAAGLYLLLNQPYGIGDEVSIGDDAGVVQEVTMFVTRVEDDDGEYIVPNRRVLEEGIALRRGD